MTKFLTFFPLCPISDHREYLGVSPDAESGTIINTLDQNVVDRLRLSNRQQVQSWTPRNKMSHKVVYDYKTKKYVSVSDSRHIRCWEHDDKTNVKFKLPQPIEEIISFDGKHTILVYKDGTWESLDHANDRNSNLRPIINEQSNQIVNIACFNTPDNNVMLTYFLRNKKTGDMEFAYFRLDNETLRPSGKVHRTKIARNRVVLSAFTVVEEDTSLSVMTIWSDRRIFMLPIDERTPTDVGRFVDMFNCLKVDKPLTIVSVSKNCVAIYGNNTREEGASLILYNTRYHVLQCKQFFKVHLDHCRLWVIGQYMLIAVGPELICAKFRISQDMLSNIIGSTRSTEFNGIVDKDSINEENELEDCAEFDAEAVRTGTPNRKALRSAEIQKTKIPTELAERLMDDLQSLYTHDISVDIVYGDSLLSERVQTRTMVHTKDQLFSNKVISLLADELEKNGVSETEITDQIVPLLIKNELSNDLAICLLKYTNISDQLLVKSLKYFLSMEESAKKLNFINVVLACSFNKDLIKGHLRTYLNLDNAIFILKHIHDALVSEESPVDESPQLGDEFDCDTVLINWFTVILDANYQQFILARDSNLNDMIAEWKSTADSFIRNIREFKSLYAILHYLVEGKKKQNENPSSKWYSVELIDLYGKTGKC